MLTTFDSPTYSLLSFNLLNNKSNVLNYNFGVRSFTLMRQFYSCIPTMDSKEKSLLHINKFHFMSSKLRWESPCEKSSLNGISICYIFFKCAWTVLRLYSTTLHALIYIMYATLSDCCVYVHGSLLFLYIEIQQHFKSSHKHAFRINLKYF